MPLNGERLRSRQPFQLWVLIVSFIYSIPGMAFTAVRPGSLQATVGPVGTVVWSAMLFLGTGCALLGIFGYRRNRATGLGLEQWGCLTVGAATLYDAAIILYANGWRASFSAAMLIGLGVASFARSRQLHKLLSSRRWSGAPDGA